MDLLLEHKKALLEKCGASPQRIAASPENLVAQAERTQLQDRYGAREKRNVSPLPLLS
jgi:hypothetical protein